MSDDKYTAEAEGWDCAHATKEELIETLACNDLGSKIVIRRERTNGK